jgi:tetratricopeptide (TPR) repeat protein
MRHLPDRRVLICWMFNALGFLFLFGRRFVIHSVLRAEFWAGLFFGEYTARYFYFLIAATIYWIPMAPLCWLTAAGLKRNKRWGLWAGYVACSLLILGFPWLTLAGGLGLYVLLNAPATQAPAAIPVSTSRSTDYWDRKRRSKVQGIVQMVLWIGLYGWVRGWLGAYAVRAGMGAWNPGWQAWLWVSAILLFNTALHESGHATVAWAVGSVVRVFSVGPFTWWRDRGGSRFRIDWGLLFAAGGYMGAVPAGEGNLRFNEIAIIAAGPATNALTCLIALDVFFALPGTAWQQWWWIVAVVASTAGLMAIGNLIPVGYCDGTMLLHLILDTRAGRLLLDRKRVQEVEEEAQACHDRADFQKEIELKHKMLDRALALGKDNATVIAACRQALGSAYVVIDEWATAEFHYRQCLGFEAELAANPMLAANVWCGIHLTATRRHDGAEAGRACASAVAILERQKSSGNDPEPALNLTMLAQTHERNRAYQKALGEIALALRVLPGGAGAIRLRAYLLRCRALCCLGAEDVAAASVAAEAAADLWRSTAIPEAGRNLAAENIADLGAELCRTGLPVLGIDLVREGIGRLESGGAAFTAARFRIKLAAILQQLGRGEEAASILPEEQTLPSDLRRPFLAARAEILLGRGHAEPAAADGRELVGLWRSHPQAPAPEIASAEALFAKALLEAGHFAAAEELASKAAEVLGPRQHPDAATCVITVALARMQSAGEHDSRHFTAALELIDVSLLLRPAEKARLKEAEAARFRRSAAAVVV